MSKVHYDHVIVQFTKLVYFGLYRGKFLVVQKARVVNDHVLLYYGPDVIQAAQYIPGALISRDGKELINARGDHFSRISEEEYVIHCADPFDDYENGWHKYALDGNTAMYWLNTLEHEFHGAAVTREKYKEILQDIGFIPDDRWF